MFRSIHTRTLLAALSVTAVVIGCTVNVDDKKQSTDPSSPDVNADTEVTGTGTADVAQSRASALVVGRVDASISGDVRIFVNESSRDVVVAPDGSFVVRDVPSGDITFGCEALSIRGSVKIEGVKAGEQIEVSVKVENNAVVITIARRSTSSTAPKEVTETKGAALEIRANNVCYFLRSGTCERDIVIHGNNVTLFGAGCSNPTVMSGKLTVRGNNAIIQDIDLRGQVLIQGNNTRVQSTCSRCYAEACYAGNPPAPPPPVDAGAPPVEDAGPAEDSGSF